MAKFLEQKNIKNEPPSPHKRTSEDVDSEESGDEPPEKKSKPTTDR